MGVILTRAPLRISLGGGGTDLPSYYRERGGFVVSAAIDKHVTMLTLVPDSAAGLRPRFVLDHLEREEADRPQDIRHPILREAIAGHWDGRPLEITSVSDVPPGTGLGSSGAYTVCVLKALRLAGGSDWEAGELAEAASRIEIETLGRAVGKQDQYAAAHGGVRAYAFRPDGSVDVRALDLPEDTLRALREEFLLFYTGKERSASEVLAHQVARTLAGDAEVLRELERTEQVARACCAALEAGDLDACADLMSDGWALKRSRAPGAVPPEAEELRALAKSAGARGVMLMGAGGGGFLLAYSAAPGRPRRAFADAGIAELPFELDSDGCIGLEPPFEP